MISYMLSPGVSISAVINGQQYTVAVGSAAYQGVEDAIRRGASEDEIENLFSAASAVKNYANGAFQVENGIVTYNGEEIHNYVVDKILAFIEAKLPHEPLVKFLGRLLENPSKRSVEALYGFLELGNMPITEDGCFLGYKGVDSDYLDTYSKKFDNHPGQRHEIKRRLVDDDFQRACSYGFHVGSLKYATGYGQRVVIVKVDPADVVSVPEDTAQEKLRTCKYEIVCDYAGPLPRPLHSDDRPYDDVDEDDDDDNDDDEGDVMGSF